MVARALWFPAAVLVVATATVGVPALAQHRHGKPAAKPSAAGASTKPSPKAAVTEPKTVATERVDAGEAPKPETTSAHDVVEHESHIEFDERMVRGQSAAGAIYLFRRTPSEFKSIVKVPDTFRERTTSLVAPRKEVP